MKRDAEQFLDTWLTSSRRKPLIIRGARQVGKTTLVRNFCKSKKINLIEINLEEIKINEMEKDKNFSIDIILKEIELAAESIVSKDSLIFLDEIQACPIAISKLRYFYEKRPELPVIASGSLLEFVLDDYKYSMPVGRIQEYHLGPLSFFEFLKAQEKDLLLKYLQESFPLPVTQKHYELLVQTLKEYLFVGGMPEAVHVYITMNSFLEVRNVHKEIINTYRKDFPKYKKGRNVDYIEDVFNYVPLHLGEKVVYSQIRSDDKSRELKKAIHLLTLAKVIGKVNYTNCSGLPLKMGENRNKFKLYFLDVGLAGYCQGLEWSSLSDTTDYTFLTKGKTAEQFVFQHLFYREKGNDGPFLHYWYSDNKNSKAEIDFVISKGNSVYPFEVKAGKSGSLKSLQLFCKQKKDSFELNPIRLDLKYRETEIDHNVKGQIENLKNHPLYTVEFW